LRVEEVHRLYPLRIPKGKSHERSGPVISGATCRTPGHVVQRGQSICLASAILLFTALLRRAGKLKIS
jgi:hypothetical protein